MLSTDMAEIETFVTELLRCPVTHSALRALEPEELAKINEAIRSSDIQDRSGSKTDVKMDGGLINEDQSLAFRIRGNILQLITDQAIELKGIL